MATHAAARSHRRAAHERTSGLAGGWVVPVLFGIAYGLYAPVVVRHGGPLSWGQFWLGLISGVVVAGVAYALIHYGDRLRRELRATAWAAYVGCAIGFLFSLSGASIYASVLLGLLTGSSGFLGAFYLFYTHEDAAGHPAPY